MAVKFEHIVDLGSLIIAFETYIISSSTLCCLALLAFVVRLALKRLLFPLISSFFISLFNIFYRSQTVFFHLLNFSKSVLSPFADYLSIDAFITYCLSFPELCSTSILPCLLFLLALYALTLSARWNTFTFSFSFSCRLSCRKGGFCRTMDVPETFYIFSPTINLMRCMIESISSRTAVAPLPPSP